VRWKRQKRTGDTLQKRAQAMVDNGSIWPLLALAVSFLPFSASAQTYPISGVWVAMDHSRFPESKVGSCLALKTFGVDAAFGGSLPAVLIFADGKRFELRGNYHGEYVATSVKSTVNGDFRITETLGKRGRWLPWTYRQSYHLKIVDPMIIEIADGKASRRFFKCSGKGPSL
jgi:hypothetical protein